MRYDVPNTENKAILALIILLVLIVLFVFIGYPDEMARYEILANKGYILGRGLNAILCN